jgi:hypothetical protein
LLAAYLYQDLINEKSIALTPIIMFQASGAFWNELAAPQANTFVTGGDASLCE